MNSKYLNILLINILLLIGQFINAKVKITSVFSDNMVLQADRSINVWGTADIAESVTVEIGDNYVTTRAGLDGKWQVELPAMNYGGPYELNVFGDDTLRLQNVMIGEVWLCAGQSNMRMTVNGVVNANKEISNANYQNIRFLTVPYGGATNPQTSFDVVWEVCSPQTIADKTATGYFFGRKLNEELNVSIGLIDVSYGGATIHAFMDKATIDGTIDNSRIYMGDRASYVKYVNAVEVWEKNGRQGYRPSSDYETYKNAVSQWELNGKKGDKPSTLSPQRFSSLCYNAMINPLIPFSLRGAIWYQGEANTNNPEKYITWFGDYINMMRDKFNYPEMPYYFVQLAGFENQPNTNIAPKSWASFRLSQEQCLNFPNTGMVTAIDIGDKTNIHPINKQEVGRRLALCALNQTYGKKDMVCKGPMLESIVTKGSKILLSFKQCEGGLRNKDKGKYVNGFSAVLTNGKEIEMKGKIISANTIEVKASNVERLRYAYDNFPLCPLYNGEGFPALPFDREVKE